MKYENGLETRETIIRVCSNLFYDKGYNATTYDLICQKAHVNRGSIYYHFKSKEEILNLIVGDKIYASARKIVDAYIPNCNNLEIYMLCVYIYWYMFIQDSKFRTLFISWAENLNSKLYTDAYLEIEKNQSDHFEYNTLDFSIWKNAGVILCLYVASHLDEFTYEQAAEYDILNDVKLRGGDIDFIQRAMAKTEENLKFVDLSKLSADLIKEIRS